MAQGLLSDFQPQGLGYGNSLLEEPVPYDLSGFKAISDVAKDYANQAYQSFLLPSRAISGEFGIPSVNNPAFVGAGQQFSMDFGMLPALATAAVARPAANTLRMGMGGSDTVSGGARRLPETDELGFYSQALETARMLPQAKGTGEQFRKMLLSGGVKPDEITFTPELEGLLSQPKVTREELVGLLEENRIRPQETVYYAGDSEFEGMNFPAQAEQLDVYDAYGRDYVADEAQYLMEDMPEDVAEAFGRTALNATEADIAKVQKALEEGNLTALVDRDSELFIDNENISDVIGTIEDAAETLVSERYSFDPVLRLQDPDTGYEIVGSDEMGYTIRNEGGDTLRGERYSLNEARIEAETDAIDRGIIGYGGGETRFMTETEEGGSNYREMLLQVPEYQGMGSEFVARGHFDEPNIAVHARTKDRNFGSGGDSLYVEELQSDWGQRGREKGFSTKESGIKKQELESTITPLMDEQMRLSKERDNLIETYAAKIADKEAAKSPLNDEYMFYSRSGSVYRLDPDESSTLVMPRSQVEELLQTDISQAYPFRPRKETEWEKGAKPKYNELTSKIKELSLKIRPIKDELSALPSGPQKGPLVGSSEKFAEAGIKRLINQAAKEGKDSVVFSSGDIQFDRWSNEGLLTFYDKILPKVGKKVAKKLDPDAFAGVKFVEDATGDVSGDRFVIQITPKMREEALRGQPLFTVPAVPTGLLGEQPSMNEMSGDEILRAGII